jgi:hypothetical protein
MACGHQRALHLVCMGRGGCPHLSPSGQCLRGPCYIPLPVPKKSFLDPDSSYFASQARRGSRWQWSYPTQHRNE